MNENHISKEIPDGGLPAPGPEPGDFYTRSIDGRSLLIVRDGAGRTRRFLNQCRHRGARLLPDGARGCRRSFVCPYHAWRYDASGALKSLPRAEAFGALSWSDFDLVEITADDAAVGAATNEGSTP
ncbi:MAG: Rieske (2Fe-2S) protein [bacterium]|nr:Rieske (2Fe-2S) protein [bacterium]